MALCVSVALLFSAHAEAQQPTGTAIGTARGAAAAGVRQATPEEVKRRLDAEAAAIEAEPAFEGLDKPLSHYIRTNLPSLLPLSRENLAMLEKKTTTEIGEPWSFVCTGDFDGDGFADTAVMMMDKTTHEVQVLAFHQTTETANPGNFKTRGYLHYQIAKTAPIVDAQLDMDEFGFVCHGADKFESSDGSVTLILKNSSIIFANAVYYFIDGQYSSLSFGD